MAARCIELSMKMEGGRPRRADPTITLELKIFKGQELLENGLAEQIVDLDRRNMQSTLHESGIEFPEDKRRRGLETDSTFIIAFDGPKIAGYLDYLPSWNNPEYIYIGSVQVEKTYRGARLLLMLLDPFRTLVAAQDFAGFETNVQKANRPAVKLYQKIGFKLEDNPRNAASWTARAGKELLTDSPVIALIESRRKRR